MTSGIYEIRNMVNGHRYIGSSYDLHHRMLQHFWALKKNVHGCRHLQNAYNKYGKENIVFTPLFECGVEYLEILEQEEIDIQKPEYNTRIIADTNRGLTRSEEVKRKMSENHWNTSGKNNPNYGKVMSEEQKKKISISRTGILHTPEAREKISNSNKGKKRSPEACVNLSNGHRGQIVSEETKRKISASKSGKPLPEETKRKMSDTWKLKIYTDEDRKIMSERTKKSWVTRREKCQA